MLYAGIGLIFTGVLYRSGIVFIILEFILHISVTMVTAGLMVWWINSVSEVSVVTLINLSTQESIFVVFKINRF